MKEKKNKPIKLMDNNDQLSCIAAKILPVKPVKDDGKVELFARILRI